MALPGTGKISLQDIEDEFGGEGPIITNEYYRGGAYVTPNNTLVPTSGKIDLLDFYNAVKMDVVYVGAGQNVVIADLFTPEQWNDTSIKFVYIQPSQQVGSLNINDPALRTGTTAGGLPLNGSLLIHNYGYIYGAGGAVGGGNGGIAFKAEVACTIYNFGRIYAGGGGGANSGHAGDRFIKNYYNGSNWKFDTNNRYIGYPQAFHLGNRAIWRVDGVNRFPQIGYSDRCCAYGWCGDVTAFQLRSSMVYDAKRGGAKYFYEQEFGAADFYILEACGVRAFTTTQDTSDYTVGGKGQGYVQTKTNGSQNSWDRQFYGFTIWTDPNDTTYPFNNDASNNPICGRTRCGLSGNGGNWGEAGGVGTAGEGTSYHYLGGSASFGGNSGDAVVGIANVTWDLKGDVKGGES